MIRAIMLTLLAMPTPIFLWAQGDSYHIKKAVGSITLDGAMTEQDWSQAEIATDFMQNFPTDSLPATSQTEIRLTYDDQNLYFLAKMYNQSPNRKYVTPSLRRDFRGPANDAITFTIDPFQDRTNAFQFGANPFGVQREGLISNGGTRGGDLSLSWDNKWYVEVQQYEGYWMVEAAIPFKTLRFKDGSKKWNINFYRIDSETGERSNWARTPQNFRIMSLAFLRELIWDQPLKKPGANVSLIPYTATRVVRDFENTEQSSTDSEIEFGGDAKIGLGPALNLDLTINPDFSQVEVDQQVTNLDRFEIFFPERRQFFLENADLFSEFGHPFLAKPFFSRRIGVAQDTSTGQNIQNKIHYGARLSGKLNNNWRIGFLNMQAAEDKDIDLPATNYTVAVVQRKVFTRSNIGAIFINKQATQDSLGDFTSDPNEYNRVAGIDFNFASADGKWNGKIFYHRSFDEDPEDGEYAHSFFMDYVTRTWTFSYAHVAIGENYDAEVGFVPRTGIFRINPELGYNFYPSSNIVNRHGPTSDAEFFWNDSLKSDHRFTLTYEIDFKNTARFEFSANQRYTYLLNSFDPTNTDGTELNADTDYTYHSLEFNYQSDFRKKIGYELSGYIGEYFNGNRLNLEANINMRFQPYGALSLNMNYNKIELPAPYNNADLFLIGPRFDLTMTKKLFWTTFIQYNSQIDNMNVNTRLQWRFKPVSDLFIVYTDNYATEGPNSEFQFSAKNRALVLKLTYWLNL